MDLNKPNKIIVHHTGGTDKEPMADSSYATAQDIDVWHKERWPGFTSKVFKNNKGEFYHVGYHIVIERDGTIVHCRALNEEGAHTIGQNKSSIGVVLSGNFDRTKPTKAQEKSFRKVFNHIISIYPKITGNDIYPHRKYANKTCYGLNLSDTYFQELLKVKDEQPVVVDLQRQVVQLATQTLSLLTKKRYSKRQIK